MCLGLGLDRKMVEIGYSLLIWKSQFRVDSHWIGVVKSKLGRTLIDRNGQKTCRSKNTNPCLLSGGT